MADAIDIRVAIKVRETAALARRLRRTAEFVARAEGFRRGALSIAVVGRRAMSTLHARHSGVPGPTDVLTFDLGVDLHRRLLDGEIVVCRDVARSRVGPRGRLDRELALYVAHGVLHLAGYDDHDPRDFRSMHAREDQLLARLGLGRVFSGDRRACRPGREARRT